MMRMKTVLGTLRGVETLLSRVFNYVSNLHIYIAMKNVEFLQELTRK